MKVGPFISVSIIAIITETQSITMFSFKTKVSKTILFVFPRLGFLLQTCNISLVFHSQCAPSHYILDNRACCYSSRTPGSVLLTELLHTPTLKISDSNKHY